MSSLITAVELSTSKVSVAVGKREQQGVVIVAYETEPTKGVKRGEVVNIQQVTTALNSALARAAEKAGEEIAEVTLCISSPFMRSEEVKISRVRRHPDDPVETKEIAELRAEAIKSRSGEKEKVYDAIAQFFDIDDHIGVPLEDIVGMQGQNLDGYYKVVIGSAASYNSRIETVKKCGLSIRRTIVSPIGAARGCIKENEAENGVVLLDIGAGLTELVIIKDKVIKEVAVIPFGGECITNDIKSISCVTRDVAELLKVRYGSCIEEGIKDNKKLVIRGKGGSEDIEVPLIQLAGVVSARVSEILEAALYIVEQLGYGDKIPAGFVITGGSAYLENIKSLGAAITDHCVRLANVQGNISDKSVDSSYDTTASSSIGAVLYAFDHKPSSQPLYEAETNKKESADKNGEPTPEEKSKTSLFGRFFGGKTKGEAKKEAQQEEPEVIAAQNWAPAGGHDEPKQKSEPRPVPTPQKGNKKTKKSEPADDGIFGTIFGELNNEA